MNIKILLTTLALALSLATVKAEEPQSNAAFHIANVASGKVLRPYDARNQDGNPIVLYSLVPWKCVTWKFVPSGNDYQLQNLFTSKTLVASAATEGKTRFVVQTSWGKEASERPSWSFVKLSDGTYKIVDAKTGLALTAVPDEKFGTRVALQEWKEQSEQKWKLQKVAPEDLTM